MKRSVEMSWDGELSAKRGRFVERTGGVSSQAQIFPGMGKQKRTRGGRKKNRSGGGGGGSGCGSGFGSFGSGDSNSSSGQPNGDSGSGFQFVVPMVIPIIPKSLNQQTLADNLANKSAHTVVVTGPSGSGKTLLAVVEGVRLLDAGLVKKIVVTRPQVPADEAMGFLPGDTDDKMLPWLLPLKDAIVRATRDGVFEKLLKDGKLEMAPMGLMRGRTFDDCYIVADEMQNSTVGQMKMVLSRTGERSKMVITGDLTQSDLRGEVNGLHNIHDIFDKIDKSGDNAVLQNVRFVELSSEDVQRSAAARDMNEIYRRGGDLVVHDGRNGREGRGSRGQGGQRRRHGQEGDEELGEVEEEPLLNQHEPRKQLPLFTGSSFKQQQECEELDD